MSLPPAPTVPGPVAPASAAASASAPVVRAAAALVIVALAVVALNIGARFLVPIAEALLVWFILKRLARALESLPLLKGRIGHGTAVAIAAALVLTLGLIATYSGVRSVLNAGPQSVNLQSSLDPLVARIAGSIGTDAGQMLDRMLEMIGVETLMQQVVLGLLGLINQFGVVAIYVAFLLADEPFVPAKLRALFPDPARRARVETLMAEIGQQVGAYLWIMTKLSFLTAGFSAVVMLGMGLQFTLFWAILIFALNYIPTIGTILGTLLPAAYALVQFGEVQPALLLLLGIGVVQFVIGNIVFPRMAGESLNLSLFVTIFSLFFWGALWGSTGMFLAVPLTAVLVIVLARFPATRPAAILMSKTGVVTAPADAPGAAA